MPDFPFCLCRANENWTRWWDGAEHEVLIKQDHSIEDHERVFDELADAIAKARKARKFDAIVAGVSYCRDVRAGQ
jgi:hypothetical protein